MNIFVWKLSKIAANKKFFSLLFSLLRYHLTVFLPPLPEVGCPIFFRASESLGKSNGKKWSQIGTFLFANCLKSPRKKKFFFLLILPWSTLLWHRCYYPHRSRDALSPVCGIFAFTDFHSLLTPVMILQLFSIRRLYLLICCYNPLGWNFSGLTVLPK